MSQNLIFRIIKGWFVPPELWQILRRSLLPIIRKDAQAAVLSSDPLPIVEEQRNESIHILGNGPSLKALLDSGKVERLKRYDLLCVNFFATSEHFASLKPKYYVFADPLFWERNVVPDLLVKRERVYHDIVKKTNWPMTVFVPLNSGSFIESRDLFIENSNIRLCRIRMSGTGEGKKDERFKRYQENKGMPYVKNVLAPSVFLGINLGYKNIYLHGADHSWHEELVVSKDNIVCLKDKHFYDEQEASWTPWRKSHDSGATAKMSEIFWAMHRNFLTYEELDEYAKYRGVKIFNVTERSYIDAFERKQF